MHKTVLKRKSHIGRPYLNQKFQFLDIKSLIDINNIDTTTPVVLILDKSLPPQNFQVYEALNQLMFKLMKNGLEANRSFFFLYPGNFNSYLEKKDIIDTNYSDLLYHSAFNKEIIAIGGSPKTTEDIYFVNPFLMEYCMNQYNYTGQYVLLYDKRCMDNFIYGEEVQEFGKIENLDNKKSSIESQFWHYLIPLGLPLIYININ